MWQGEKCPRCGKDLVRRRPGRGLTEKLLSLFLIYPFRCQLCAHRYVSFLGRHAFAPRREYMRLPAQYPISVWLADSEGTAPIAEGTLVDLSIRGCGLKCSIPLKEGLMIRLNIRPPEEPAPVVVEGAMVRYCGRDRIGVQFQVVRAAEEARLSHLVQQLWVKTDLPAHSWKFAQEFAARR